MSLEKQRKDMEKKEIFNRVSNQFAELMNNNNKTNNDVLNVLDDVEFVLEDMDDTKCDISEVLDTIDDLRGFILNEEEDIDEVNYRLDEISVMISNINGVLKWS